MPLWLDLLRTPMAAPETPRLRRMRRIFQALCVALCLTMLGFSALHAWLGQGAVALGACLLIATGLYTPLYFIKKDRADRAWLDALGSNAS
jgi:hypothetical protein